MAYSATPSTTRTEDGPKPGHRGPLEAFNAYAHSVGLPGNGLECWLRPFRSGT